MKPRQNRWKSWKNDDAFLIMIVQEYYQAGEAADPDAIAARLPGRTPMAVARRLARFRAEGKVPQDLGIRTASKVRVETHLPDTSTDTGRTAAGDCPLLADACPAETPVLPMELEVLRQLNETLSNTTEYIRGLIQQLDMSKLQTLITGLVEEAETQRKSAEALTSALAGERARAKALEARVEELEGEYHGVDVMRLRDAQIRASELVDQFASLQPFQRELQLKEFKRKLIEWIDLLAGLQALRKTE